MSLHLVLQNLANGLSLGSLYALIAIGDTMVYGILRLINFAHGEIFYAGALFSFLWIINFSFTMVGIIYYCDNLNSCSRNVI